MLVRSLKKFDLGQVTKDSIDARQKSEIKKSVSQLLTVARVKKNRIKILNSKKSSSQKKSEKQKNQLSDLSKVVEMNKDFEQILCDLNNSSEMKPSHFHTQEGPSVE